MFLYNCTNEYKLLCFKLVSLFYSNLPITGLWKQRVVAYCRMLHSVNRSILFDIGLLMVNPKDEMQSDSGPPPCEAISYHVSSIAHTIRLTLDTCHLVSLSSTSSSASLFLMGITSITNTLPDT